MKRRATRRHLREGNGVPEVPKALGLIDASAYLRTSPGNLLALVKAGGVTFYTQSGLLYFTLDALDSLASLAKEKVDRGPV
jgi:hypothetical protein